MTCKIFEHIIYRHILKHIVAMFSSEQHGLASIILVKATIKDFAVQINSGAQNDTILLNISKAFDKFLHQHFTTRAYDNGQSLDIFSQIKHMPDQIKLDRQIFLHYQRVPFSRATNFADFVDFQTSMKFVSLKITGNPIMTRIAD